MSSINPGVQDGEHEYIKISQPILPGSDRANSNLAAISRIGERNAHADTSDDLQSLGRNPSIASFDSIDSMNVERDRTGNHLPDDVTMWTEPPCGCSLEAKMVISAALSRISHESSNYINIPTADMNTSLSDLNSVSDMDPLASYSSFRGSLGSDIAATNDLTSEDGVDIDKAVQKDPNHNHLADLNNTTNDQEAVATIHSISSASSLCQPPFQDGQEELGYIINQVDGLELTRSKHELMEPHRKSTSAKKSNRTVTFAEEILTPSVPNCTPESTPRDPTDVDSVKSDTDMYDTQEVDDSEPRSQSRESNQSVVTEELSVLRSKVKSDLVKTQEATQSDIEALKAQRINGKTWWKYKPVCNVCLKFKFHSHSTGSIERFKHFCVALNPNYHNSSKILLLVLPDFDGFWWIQYATV